MATVIVIKDGGNKKVMRFNPDWTCAQAKKEIREWFLFEGGHLEDDDTGFVVGGDEKLENRHFRFVGGRRPAGIRSGDYLHRILFRHLSG